MIRWVDVARISGKHGTKGRLVVSYSANLPSIVEEGMELFLVPPLIDVPRKLHLSFFQEVSFHSARVEFVEIDSIDVAQRVLGCHLLVEGTEGIEHALMDADGLEGLAVIDEVHGLLGHVVEILDNGPQQILEIDRDGDPSQSIMLPFVEEFVKGIDDDAVHVLCPQGLLEL